jgi:hypothetical protein
VHFCVACLIVVPLPPGKNPFAVQLNNSKLIILSYLHIVFSSSLFQSYSHKGSTNICVFLHTSDFFVEFFGHVCS